MKNLHEGLLMKRSHIIILSVLFSLILIFLAYLYHSNSAEYIKMEKEKDLQSIAKLKIEQINRWHYERTGDARVISKSPSFVSTVDKWLKNVNDIKLKKEISERLELPHKEYNYETIFLTSKNGELLFSVGSQLDQLDSSTTDKIEGTANNGDLSYTDFYYCPTHEKIHYDIIAPIIKEGLTIANLVFRVDPSAYLYPLIQTWPHSSRTAESILLRKDGDSILYLNELRHQKNTALKYRLPLTRKDLPAVQAALGKTGLFEGTDYRGIEVLAYLNPIPTTNWFMVTKIDKDEMLSELSVRGAFVAILLGLLILSMIVALALLYNYRQRNIYKKLLETQEEFRTTLYSIGDGVITTDTSGRVKHLNLTAEKLTGWIESDAINKPLKDVFKIINEDSRQKVENPVQKVIREGTVVGLANHTLLISKDGIEIPISDSGAPIKNERGELIGVVLVFQDQTKERAAQKELQKSETFVRTVLDNLPIGIAVNSVDPTVNFEYMNYNFTKYYRTTQEDLADPNAFWDAVYEDADFREEIKRKVLDDCASGDIKRMQWEDIPISRKGEKTTFISARNIPLPDDNLAISVVWDVTDRKLAEQEIIHLNRLYAMLSQSNQAIVRLDNREDLFKEVTKDAIDYGKFRLAWIGLFNSIKSRIEPHTWYGENNGFIEDELLPAPDDKRRLMPCTRAYFENQIVIINDVETDPACDYWRNAALSRSYKSLAAAPINSNGSTVGVFVLYSSEVNFFKEKEINLLQEISYDISFALNSYNKEEKRKIDESEKALLSDTIERSINEIYIFDAVSLKFRFVNKGATNNLGYSLSELREMTPLNIKPQVTSEQYNKMIEPLFKKEKEFEFFETVHRRKDGTDYPVEVRLQLFDYEREKVFLAVIQDVTKQKLATIALKQSEEKFRTIFNTSIEGICVSDIDENITLVNPHFAEITGYSTEELLKMNFKDLITADELAIHLLQKVERKKGDSSIYERQFKRKDGAAVWVKVSATPLLDNKGAYEGSFGMFTDITEQKLAEIEIRKLYQGVEQSPASVVITDVEGNIEYVNKKFCSITGYLYSEVIGKNPRVLNSGEMPKEEYAEMWNNILSGKEWIGEFHNKKKNGELFWESALISPVSTEKGEITHFIAIKEDITEKKRIDEMMIKSESQFRSVWESSFDGMRLTDWEGRIIKVNDAFCKMVDKTKSELEGALISTIQKADQEDHILKIHQKRFRERDISKYFEREIELWNGDRKWFGVSNSFVELANNEKLLLGIFRDITAAKKDEIDLITAKEKAEEMNKIKSYFFANMSHELRTPFVGIQGYAELLAESLTEPENLQMVDRIIESSKRLTDTLDKVLSLSKVEFEGIQVFKSHVDINGLLETCYNLFISTTTRKGVAFNLKLLDPPLIMISDEKLLSGIVTNLINNAIKFTSEGKIELSAKTEIRNSKEHLVLKISDTGIGIPAEKQNQIWMAFRQVSEGLNRSFEGTGLGLTICKKYVELLNGTITLESESGKGSTFIVDLPVRKNAHQKLPERPVDEVKHKADVNAKPPSKKILYVEDDEMSRDVMARTLSKYYEIDVVENAELALEKVYSINYDALLIDINLGKGMDGMQFLESIKEMGFYKSVPKIAITAYAAVSDRDEFLSKGFTHYISKPLALSNLVRLINGIFHQN